LKNGRLKHLSDDPTFEATQHPTIKKLMVYISDTMLDVTDDINSSTEALNKFKTTDANYQGGGPAAANASPATFLPSSLRIKVPVHIPNLMKSDSRLHHLLDKCQTEEAATITQRTRPTSNRWPCTLNDSPQNEVKRGVEITLELAQLIGSADVIGYPHLGDKSVISFFSLGGALNITAISNQVMRVGSGQALCHIPHFRDRRSTYLPDFGAIRPIKDWDKKGLHNLNPLCIGNDPKTAARSCFPRKLTNGGRLALLLSQFSWRLQSRVMQLIGMGKVRMGGNGAYPITDDLAGLVDLKNGTLTVFKDGRKLGVMKEGFTGAYCWFVGRYGVVGAETGKRSIEIKRGMPPVE
ncbi:hypothetical protein THAOC_08791, partial [Thalassiosira oceanica]